MSYEMYRQHFEGESFSDLLVEQLRRAPWLLISLAVHLAIGLILSFFLKDDDGSGGPPEVEMAFDQNEDEEEEEEPEEIEEEEPEEQELVEDPVEVDEEVDDHDEDETNEEYEESVGEEDQISDKPFDGKNNNDAIGLGGGAGGSFGGRRGGRKRARRGRGRRAQRAVDLGLEWLARHQSEDGRWDADDFNCKECSEPCGGKGGALHDVGVTGLALLAFLGAGETHKVGDYKKNVKNGLRWLKEQQDPEGCFGPRTDRRFTYNHGIGALAMSEAYVLTKSPLFKTPAQKGIDFVVACQNPYKAWRYGEQPGDNDTSVTGWMVMALKSAKSAGGLLVPDDSMKWALDWIEEMTDEETGRTGYIKRGELPVREEGKQEAFPSSETESLTAVGMMSRVFCGQDPAENAAIKLGAELLQKKLPNWDTARGSIDMYYWYYGSLAMYQVGGSAWNAWNKAMSEAVIESQHTEGSKKGSWDPIGAWGEEGGRVYATALQTMCLEVYYRYGRVFGVK